MGAHVRPTQGSSSPSSPVLPVEEELTHLHTTLHSTHSERPEGRHQEGDQQEIKPVQKMKTLTSTFSFTETRGRSVRGGLEWWLFMSVH